ncbi:MAG: 4-(cytidine 5'-diphospho)-2-C-methyl-D-erythritol kinase [Myxococcota bacterium]
MKSPVAMQRFAPAKVNLSLRVLGRRPDGYHAIETVLVPLTLGDLVEVSLGGRGVTLVSNDPGLPKNEDNLAVRAAARFLAEAGLRRGVRIGIGKTIPVAAGLGGGSSDAAAVLTALNALTGKPLSKKALAALALSLGADVPFFLGAGPALARGIGEILTPLPALPPAWFVLVNPGFEIRAAWAYGRWREALTTPPPHPKVPPFSRDWSNLGASLSSDLEAVILPRYPVLRRLKERLIGLGAVGALVSGSGPTVFGVFREATGAQRAFEALRLAPRWQVFLARALQPA